MTLINQNEPPPQRRAASTGLIRNEAAFVSTYPGLTPAMLGYMAETIAKFVRSK